MAIEIGGGEIFGNSPGFGERSPLLSSQLGSAYTELGDALADDSPDLVELAIATAMADGAEVFGDIGFRAVGGTIMIDDLESDSEPSKPYSHSLGMSDTDEDRSWQDSANCLGVDPDLFFPERGGSTREAKEVCRGCSVRPDCLEYAIVEGERFGIWGGASERERRRIRRQRAQAARRPSA